MKIIYTSDLHGNALQYQKLFERSNERNFDAIIVGGDLLPKDAKNRTIEGQRKFIQNELSKLIGIINKDIKLFLILGNDDFICTLKYLRQLEKMFNNLVILNSDAVKINGEYFLAGYSYVPPTPFACKDWEKYDFKGQKTVELDRQYIKNGITSISGKIEPFELSGLSIGEDLEELVKKSSPNRTIYVMHSPPFNTHLDIIKNKSHVGSHAIRRFIETRQPPLTLHGHIHETVEMSGRFKDKIGKTTCITSGNDHAAKELAVVEFNLANLENMARKMI